MMGQDIFKMSCRAALKWAANYLSEKGVCSPLLDAELLLGFRLGVDRVQLHVDPERMLSSEEWAGYKDLIGRRGWREPLQYIIGKTEFMSLQFEVNRDVLVPRADTEVLVENALDWSKQNRGTLRVLDLCTGSGAIAVSLAYYLEDAQIWAGDISAAALKVAERNAEKCGVQVRFSRGDLTEPFQGMLFDLVTANPPYIPREVISSLEPEVAQEEPRLALDGGADGLDFYRRLACELPAILAPKARLFLEIGWDQGLKVKDIFVQAGFYQVRLIKDYAGRDRVLTGLRAQEL